MPATLYFGAPVASNQTVSKEVADLGLEYLRESPSAAPISIVKEYKQPGHVVYKEYIPTFISLAQNPGTRISSRASIFRPLQHNQTTPFMRAPTLRFSFSTQLKDDLIRDIQSRFGAREVRFGRNLSFDMATNDMAKVRELIKYRPSPLVVTKVGTSELNIKGLQTYLFLHRLFDAFARTNQYPGFKTNDITDVGTFANFGLISNDVADEAKETCSVTNHTVNVANPDMSSPHDRQMMFYGNLAVPFSTFNYVVKSDTDLSPNMTGLFIPFVSVLAKSDYQVIPRVVSRYFLGALASNAESCTEQLEEVKSAWGTICITPWGDELAHMFRCIEIALEAQATIRVVMTNQNLYRGIILYGGMYTIVQRLKNETKIYRPVPPAELSKELAQTNPHQASLKFIYDNIMYPDQAGRVAAMNAATSLHDVSLQIRTQGIIISRQEEITRKAQLLTFPMSGAGYLAVTSHNIVSVMTAISDQTISELKFPLHPDAICSTRREERLLSAFGSEVPSFRVPGGKAMSLSGNFSVRERGPDGKGDRRDIHAVGAVLLPLNLAMAAYDEMSAKKEILNPFGTKLASQASSSSIIKKWQKEDCSNVVAALRLAIGATVATESDSKGKRKAEDYEDDERGGKKVSMGFEI